MKNNYRQQSASVALIDETINICEASILIKWSKRIIIKFKFVRKCGRYKNTYYY